MLKYNQDASGDTIYVDFGEDVSTATAFTMELEPEAGDKVEVTPTLGTGTPTVGDKTLTANHYVYYTTTAGMFDDFVGRWRKKATATLAAGIVAADYTFFRVTP